MTKTSLTPPSFDQATIDRYIARGRRARSEAIFGTVRSVFGRSRD